MLIEIQKQRRQEEYNESANFAFVVRWLGQWKENKTPSIKDLIGESPHEEETRLKNPSVEDDKDKTIEQWKQWARIKGLKIGGDM